MRDRCLASAVLIFLSTSCVLGDDDGPGGSSGTDSGTSGADGGGSDAGTSGPAPERVERYLRGDLASQLVIEVDSVSGREPPSAVSDSLTAALDAVLDKPGGIEVQLDGAVTSMGADHAWTDDELRALVEDTRSFAETDGTVSIHAVFVDGHSARDGDGGVVLGLALDLSNLVLFRDTIDDACSSATIGPLFRDQLCESTLRNVWLHEVGHVIGLVNRGLPMQTDHQDEAHGAHDANDACVMYWAAETGALVSALADRIVGGASGDIGFDEQCLADIAAVRDR